MALKYVDEIDLKNKKVIARFDFNVPLSKDGSGKISDATRIDRALPTIRYILAQGPKKLILMSHLGRPKAGEDNSAFTLEPVGNYLSEALNEDVTMTQTCTDAGIKTLLDLNTNRVILLENVRFHKEETKNDSEFSKILASYADIYVNDAFGTCHRKHASTYGIVAHMPKGQAVGGFLLRKEIEALTRVSESPKPPFVAITGGAKVSDKIKILERLMITANKVIIGGAMAYPFLKAQGYSVGKSLCADEDVKLAKKLLDSPQKDKLELPIDHLVSDSLEGSAQTIHGKDIPENLIGLDIGPESIKHFREILQGAQTILWNGPMGLFENKSFATGTFAIAEILASAAGYTVIGGGDSVSAVKKSGLSDKMGHISTGGGASLEFIEEGTLPGIQALKFGVN